MTVIYKADKCELVTALGIGGAPDSNYGIDCSGTNAGLSLKEVSASLAAKTNYGILYNIVAENEIEYTDPDGVKHVLLMDDEVTKSIQLHLLSWKLEVANPPSAGSKDEIYTLDFDPSTEESIYLAIELPDDYKAAGGASIRLKMFVDVDPPGGGGNKAVYWGVEYKKHADGDIFNFAAGTASAGGNTALVEGEGDCKIHHITIAIATTGYAAGDTILVRLFRDATNGGDDYPSDARLFCASLLYKSERRG
jgi:hypothetical protein